MRTALAAASLWAGVAVGSSAGASAGAGATAPRVFVEAELDPPELPVNLQATLVVRLGYAVDVRSPRFELPRPRLAEVLPLGKEVVREVVRNGLRYRVHEQAWAVVPFARGEIELVASAAGQTPATLPELGGRRDFRLDAAPLRLRVLPAAGEKDGLAAYNLQFSRVSAAPAPEGAAPRRVGDVFVRRVTVEAGGVLGPAIPPLRWPESSGFALRHDPPQAGTRVDGRRLIGWRTETARVQAVAAGSFVVPAPDVAWRSFPGLEPRTARLAEERFEVGGHSLAETGGTAPDSDPAWIGWLAIFIAAGAVSGLAAWHSRRRLADAWRQAGLRRLLRRAARNGDAEGARLALLALGDCRSLEQCRQRAIAAGNAPLAGEIARLEAACYGRPEGPPWSGEPLASCRARL